MQRTAAPPSLSLTETQQLTGSAGNLIGRKLWLPKFLYDALPYFYVVSGVAAFLGTLYISEWFWVLPHYLLFSAACVHLGIIVYKRRNPDNHTNASGDNTIPDEHLT